MNGMINKCAQILDTIFSPKERLIHQPIYIMWSRVDEQEKGQDWSPNHFIPLMESGKWDLKCNRCYGKQKTHVGRIIIL